MSTGRELTPHALVAELDRSIIGQEQAKRTVATAVCAQLVRAFFSSQNAAIGCLEKQNVLLAGPSGCGKTLIVRSIAELVGIPFVTVDTTRFLEESNYVEEIARDLATAALRAEAPLDRGIVYLDEVDKLCDSERGRTVQRQLLTILQGRVLHVVVDGMLRDVDTTHILFIASGAFIGLAEIVESRLGSSGWGFKRKVAGDPPMQYLIAADLEQYGLLREFVSRFPLRESLRALREDELVRVLRDSPLSPLRQAQLEFVLHRVRLDFDESAVRELSHQASGSPAGVRVLQELVSHALAQTRFDLPELASRGIGRVVLTENAIRFGQPDLVVCPPLPPLAPPPPAQGAMSAAALEAQNRLFPPGSLPRRPRRASSTVYGSGRWANEEDVQPWLSGIEPRDAKLCGTLIVEAREDGSQLKPLLDRSLYLPDDPLDTNRDLRRRHVFCVGKTGCGKTTRFILPLVAQDIRDPDKSVVVIDAQLELTPYVYALVRKHRGPQAKIIYFNPKEPNRSAAWNPLDKVDTVPAIRQLIKDLSAGMPVVNDGGDYFRGQAEKRLVQMVRALLRARPEEVNFGSLAAIVDEGDVGMAQLFKQAGMDSLSRWAAAGDDRNVQTTMREMENLVECWTDDEICACTASSEFSFEELDRQPTVLIFATAEEHGARLLRGLRTMFMSAFVTFMMQRRRKGVTRTISLFVDEFASAVGRLHDLETRIQTLRKNGFALVAAVQQLQQVYHVYGSLAGGLVLGGFNSHFFLPPLAEDDAEWVSQKSGEMTVELLTASGSGSVAQSGVTKQRVMTRDEVNRNYSKFGPPATVMLLGKPCFQMFLQPSYQDKQEEDIFSAGAPRPDAPLRPESLKWSPPHPVPKVETVAASPGLPPGITDTRGWTDERIRARLEEVKRQICWTRTVGSARKWWEAFENENTHRLALVLRLAEELLNRKATITEFFLTYVYSNTDNVQANLHYLDYVRLKKIEERRKQNKPTDDLDRNDCAEPDEGNTTPPER